MSQPLFTPEEISAFNLKQERLDKKRKEGSISWDDCSKEHINNQRAHEMEKTKRAQARAEEFLNALIILVGNRGTKYVPFDMAFEKSGSHDLKKELAKHDTPEVRRTLYTILKALTEVPKSWARSAFVRFLRGIGKQKNEKYHGAGMLGAQYGWKGNEVTFICEVVAGSHELYAQVLMSYADMEKEIREIREADPEFQITDYSVKFKAVNVERDVKFLNQLCSILEAKGLAAVPTPSPEKPTKPRKVKVFKPGDVIRRKDLRDLPLPAHVRIKIEKRHKDSSERLNGTIEQVVTGLHNDGYYSYYLVAPNGKAYRERFNGKRKEWLDGAIYLGPWTGQIVKNEEIETKFYYTLPDGKTWL